MFAPTSIPDHSVLTWQINLNSSFSDTPKSETLQTDQTFGKFDVSAIPSGFLSRADVLRNVNEVIFKLDYSLRTQRDIDSAFSDWCGIVGANMYDELPYKTILSGVSNKKRKVGKHWWSDRLSNLWNDACIAERSW